MVTVKEAVASALEFAKLTLGEEIARSARLEEVETGATHGGSPGWLVTLSFMNPDFLTDFDPFSPAASNRIYKVFSVLQEDGEVVSMKIREFAAR